MNPSVSDKTGHFDEIVDQFQIGLKRHNLFCEVSYDPSLTVFKSIFIPDRSGTMIKVPHDTFVCIETDLFEREGHRYHLFAEHAGKYYYTKMPALCLEPTAELHEEQFSKLVTIASTEIHRWKHPVEYTPPQTRSFCEGRTC